MKFLTLLTLFPTLLMGDQEYIKLSHQISDPFVKEYSQRTGLRLMGAGGGMVDDIDLICLTFTGRHRLDLPAARRLYVKGVEDLLNRYNTSKTVRPYLHNFPFTTSNLSFMVIFEDRPGTFVKSNYVAGIYCVKDILFYRYRDHELDKLVDLYEESYEEAVRIVHAECERPKNND